MGWTKTKDGELVKFSCFASDIEAYHNKSKKNVRCPVCRKEITMAKIYKNPKAHGDEPLAVFKPVCPHCGIFLTIFND